MKLSKKWLLLIPALVGVLTAASDRKPEPQCVVAERWVKEHSASLPTTLTALSKHELSYRKAIYRELPHDVQLRLWHEQFAYYRNSPALTTAQKAFIEEFEPDVDRYFSPGTIAAFDAKYTARARALLGDSLAHEVLANLGVGTPDVTGQPGTNCECNADPDQDWCIFHGCRVVNNCNYKDSGCGNGWCHPCNGCCGDVCGA